LSQFTRVTDSRTDRQTDRILIAIPRLHYMQRGKNCTFYFILPFLQYRCLQFYKICRRNVEKELLIDCVILYRVISYFVLDTVLAALL